MSHHRRSLVAVARVAVVFHTERSAACDAAVDLVRWLQNEGHEPWLPAADAAVAGLEDLGQADDHLAQKTALAISLGGDGNMLRTVRHFTDHKVPVLGVNFGQLGYLTEVEPAEATAAVARFFAGEHSLEERMTMSVQVVGPEGAPMGEYRALNEGVVEKEDTGKVVRLALYFNDVFFTTYAADGLIVATPTGSTAYNLSARGPIVDPNHRAILLTPVAPHMLFDRSIVLKPDDVVRIEVLPDRPAALAVDGHTSLPLEVGSSVEFTAAALPTYVVTFGERDFHARLKAKFELNDR